LWLKYRLHILSVRSSAKDTDLQKSQISTGLESKRRMDIGAISGKNDVEGETGKTGREAGFEKRIKTQYCHTRPGIAMGDTCSRANGRGTSVGVFYYKSRVSS